MGNVTPLPPPVEAGKPVRAAHFNALRDAIGAAADFRELSTLARMVKLGLVVNRSVPDPVPAEGVPADTVTYSIALAGLGGLETPPEAVTAGVVPWMGRPVPPGDSTNIIPAAIGSPVILFRVADGAGGLTVLALIPETLPFASC